MTVVHRHGSKASLSRVLVAADSNVDPHRLVALCCQQPDSEMLSVSLLVPLASGSEAESRGGGARATLLRKTSGLLDAAGVRLDDFVLADEDNEALDDLVGSGEFDAVLICANNEAASSPVLPLTARLARLHGLAVVEGCRNFRGPGGWLRRMMHLGL